MSDEWFSNEIAPDGVAEDGCDPLEAQALKDYIRHKTSAKEAAVAITRPIETEANPPYSQYRLWGLLGDALQQLSPSLTSALVQLMGEIDQLPTTIPRGSSNSSVPPDHVLLWRGLPGFGHQWSDEHLYDSGPSIPLTEPTSQADRENQRAEHIKTAGVEAQLANASLAQIPMYWGYNCICNALERSEAVLDFEVPAATEWFNFAGKRIRAAAVDGTEIRPDGKVRDLWTSGSDMLNLERWSFWEQRFRELLGNATTVTHDAVVRVAAQRAVEIMERLTMG